MNDREAEYIDATKMFKEITLTCVLYAVFGGEFDTNWMKKKWHNILDGIAMYVNYGT
jgi:predicted small integral membrane protein